MRGQTTSTLTELRRFVALHLQTSADSDQVLVTVLTVAYAPYGEIKVRHGTPFKVTTLSFRTRSVAGIAACSLVEHCEGVMAEPPKSGRIRLQDYEARTCLHAS